MTIQFETIWEIGSIIWVVREDHFSSGKRTFGAIEQLEITSIEYHVSNRRENLLYYWFCLPGKPLEPQGRELEDHTFYFKKDAEDWKKEQEGKYS